MTDTPLKLYNSLTRAIEEFRPIRDNEARVYTCGPTVYNYQHIGNMRAFLFADTLGRVLKWKGYKLRHIINITDVGHLTSDADAGDDKMEKAARAEQKSIWDIAAHYTAVFKADIERLNITQPAEWTVATDYVPQMIEFAKQIADKHCYEIDSGLYFDSSTVPDYGRLARATTGDGESRIDPVSGKRHPQDFAIWRKSPPGEQRQMEWESPWGKGAPGWHLECSVMSLEQLGHPFDIHTGGIDHREVHHPNEIAQNQAHCGCDSAEPGFTGARIWMHNNFLVDRGGKMSKSTGEFLTLQVLVDRGIHPLSYRLMCLSAHYRSELEFTWENVVAAQTRLKRIIQTLERLRDATPKNSGDTATYLARFDEAVSDDLNTSRALPVLDALLADKSIAPGKRLAAATEIDGVLGLEISSITRADLRVRPSSASIDADVIEAKLIERKEARAAKDFARSDAIRDELAAAGVEVMDGDPLGWDWKIA
ncbi:cysteine--tRNA ligase [Sphingomonas sp. AX6]|uniref:cysteine--tRNA ligase n=1 Tax=Sphingomonas sp. AX6 TaxID=2653171 RepID=UPI0012F3FDBB|nr:cysteine--tRNA ligase [Sphingomonas sp. AX6]VXC99304.1 Cysteine--tRNA ligase [Sphingomonas sp. AX6]